MLRIGVALTVCVVLGLGLMSSTASAGKPVSTEPCQKDGWQRLYTRTGEPFADKSACMTYAADGGVLLPQAALACLHGGWAALGPSPSTIFAGEQAASITFSPVGLPSPP